MTVEKTSQRIYPQINLDPKIDIEGQRSWPQGQSFNS